MGATYRRVLQMERSGPSAVAVESHESSKIDCSSRDSSAFGRVSALIGARTVLNNPDGQQSFDHVVPPPKTGVAQRSVA